MLILKKPVTNYEELLVSIIPKPIHNKDEKERLMGYLDILMSIDESDLSDGQNEMLELIAILIEDYERNMYLTGGVGYGTVG